MATQAQQNIELDHLRGVFARANLERLSRFEPPSEPSDAPDFALPQCKIALGLLKKWSANNADSITQAIDAQAFGGHADISWPTAFLPFMESTAMYLRDWGLLLEAWKRYREYKRRSRVDEVELSAIVDLYQSAFDQIRELAQTWGMDFVSLCDLVTEHPDGHVDWDGPYCGAFVTTTTQQEKPFIGVAFKGTNPLQLREIAVDYNYQLVAAQKPFLRGVRVSEGVYTGLFGTFAVPNDPPYDNILLQLEAIAAALPNTAAGNPPVRTHVTGHSLGGSYSSLCYANMLVDSVGGLKLAHLAMGDEYTYGAPRVGSEGWAVMNGGLVTETEGQSWRVVNADDLVPRVPPTLLKPDQTDFYHIDRGMRIFSDKKPEPIPSEIGLPPPPPLPLHTIKDIIEAVIGAKNHGRSSSLLA